MIPYIEWILVLPAESNPSINTRISLLPKSLDNALPILLYNRQDTNDFLPWVLWGEFVR